MARSALVVSELLGSDLTLGSGAISPGGVTWMRSVREKGGSAGDPILAGLRTVGWSFSGHWVCNRSKSGDSPVEEGVEEGAETDRVCCRLVGRTSSPPVWTSLCFRALCCFTRL